MNSLISIIVPIYNSEHFLLECLNSVLNQTYTNWELILVDDQSKDNTLNIANQFKFIHPNKFISIFTSKNNSGPGHCRNIGINHAKGEWLFFIDSDDLLISDCLQKLINNSNNKDIIVGNYYIQKNETRTIKHKNLVKMFNFSKYALGMYAWGTLFKTSYWKSNNFYFKNLYAEDLICISQIYTATNNITVINEPIYIYRVNYSSLSHSLKPFERIRLSIEELITIYINTKLETNETIAFVLSNCYNLIKMIDSNIGRYRAYKILSHFIHKIDLSNEYCLPPLLNKDKLKKLKFMYLTNGVYLLIKFNVKHVFNLIWNKLK